MTVSSDNQLRKIELMGNDGKQLASFNANGNTMTIDLSNYSSGTYFLCITTTEGLFIRRLVKK
ncbi:MAG: T9SS type A sorting domain-containing protein [Bacteroidales bacterium]|nr:T9SS type A sorting domain-containing protein [Bacteroidales bacterium]